MTGRIAHIWAWVGIMPDGDEGVLLGKGPTGVVPMIHTTRAGIELLRGHALQAAGLGIEVGLVCFTGREDIETLPPPAETSGPTQGTLQ